MGHYNERFKDAPWYTGCTNENILMVGCGGIGSNTLYFLSKSIPAKYWIVDSDIVEEYNVGCQFFTGSQIGKYKVEALVETLTPQSLAKFNVFNQKYSDGTYFPITITALDNMETRKQVFNDWKTRSNREIFIDGRLRASLYEVYVVTPGKEEEYEKTLFEDSEVDEGPCTFKQTAHFGGLIGARITQILVNYLTNKYAGEEICSVPFKVSEIGEPFIMEII